MKIEPNQDFRHQGQLYRTGELREVDDAEGYYFVTVGWARRMDEPVAEETAEETGA